MLPFRHCAHPVEHERREAIQIAIRSHRTQA
jgi:hypothetical protein